MFRSRLSRNPQRSFFIGGVSLLGTTLVALVTAGPLVAQSPREKLPPFRDVTPPTLTQKIEDAMKLDFMAKNLANESKKLADEAADAARELLRKERQTPAPPLVGTDNIAYLEAQRVKAAEIEELRQRSTTLLDKARARQKEADEMHQKYREYLEKNPDVGPQLAQPGKDIPPVKLTPGEVLDSLKYKKTENGDTKSFDGNKSRPSPVLVPGPGQKGDPPLGTQRRSQRPVGSEQLVAGTRPRGYDEDYERNRQKKQAAEEEQERARKRAAEREFLIQQDLLALQAEKRDLDDEERRLASEHDTLRALIEDIVRRIRTHNDLLQFVDSTNENAVYAHNSIANRLNAEKASLEGRCRDWETRHSRLADRGRQYEEHRKDFLRKWGVPSQP